MAKTIRNTFVIFLVSGFWHGANWTFIVWGGLNALFIMPSIIFKTNRRNLEIVAQGRLFPNLRELFQMLVTFCLTIFAWIFFRAESVGHAFSYLKGIVSSEHGFRLSFSVYPELVGTKLCLILVFLFVIIEWFGRESNYAIKKIGVNWPTIMRWSFYSLLLLVIGLYFSAGGSEFIYFQF